MFTLVVFAGVFELDGDEGELEVGEEGGVEPVVAGGGLAVVLHAAEDAFHDVPPLVRLPVIVPWVRAVPLGRRDRRRAERLGQQAGGIPLVGAVHEQLRAHECAERGHGAAPVGRVVLVARAQMDFDERRLAVGYHVNFGVPASPGYADGLRPPFFFRAPVACWWTFTLVESMASTLTSTAMIRSSCRAANRRSIAPFLDQRLNRW